MTPEQIKQAVEDGIRAAYTNPEFHCRYSISPEEHQKEHEALRKFISFVGKVDAVKWDVFKKLIAWFVIGAFSLMLYGAAVKIKLLKLIGG